MAEPLVDLASLDLSRDVLPEEELRTLIPHRHEFQMIDGVCHLDPEEGVIVSYKNWDEDAWWGRGHIPGRPIMPGVLMIESCAQSGSILMKRVPNGWDVELIGLIGVDNARFRGQVVPPAKVHYIAKVKNHSRRASKHQCQALFNGQVVFEMDLLGMPL